MEQGVVISNAQLDCRLLEGEIVVAHIKRTCRVVWGWLHGCLQLYGRGLWLGFEVWEASRQIEPGWRCSSGLRFGSHGRFQMPP